MAQDVSDALDRGAQDAVNTGRAARLYRPEETPAQKTLEVVDAPSRRASFRPAEEIARRRDVVEAFLGAIRKDETLLSDSEAWVADSLRGQLLAEESLGRYEDAAGSWARLKKVLPEGERPYGWARRVYRGLGDDSLAADALRREIQAREGETGLETVLLGLEDAHDGWRRGLEPEAVLSRIERAIRGLGDRAALSPFAALWASQIATDTLLETGRFDAAMTELETLSEHRELSTVTRQMLVSQQAVWLHVLGKPDIATDILWELANAGQLPGDLDETLLALLFEYGDLDRVFTVLRRASRPSMRRKARAVTLSMLHETAASNPSAVRNVLKTACEADEHDWTLWRVREHLLEPQADRGVSGVGTELIDVLNRRLEGPMSVDERVSALTRLGRLYEVEAELEEAAAEVYREALNYAPDHVPALRALGRIYTRRGHWRGLVDLYEREIATMADSPSVWRRHFQVAELYEVRLENDERALEHYLVVLQYRPNYLPALKASARLLGRLERWTQLADLFLGLVETAPSRRQKLYLLDKVAEVAESRLENFDVAIGAWLEILELEPAHPRAYSSLGRLYARTGRWQDLIAINLAEIELIEDDDEIAATHLRNAEIFEQYLGDIESAEESYRKALDIVPDYLPALEGLGRIFMRGGRWSDIVRMTGQELRAMDDPAEALRQLGALAELFETRLERRRDAIHLYEEIFVREPGNAHVFATLLRLHRLEGSWPRIAELIEQRLHTPLMPAERVGLLGDLALIEEWRLGDARRAFGHYWAALLSEPDNLHWLEGITRTWKGAGWQPGALADELEDLLMRLTDGRVRDAFFAVLARLRERDDASPGSSRAYRAHGAADSLENQMVLRLAMACAGERSMLIGARRANPHYEGEGLTSLGRSGLGPAELRILDREKGMLDIEELRWLATEIELEHGAWLLDDDACEHALRGRDFVAILSGQSVAEGIEDEGVGSASRRRLRAIEAWQQGDLMGYLSWTRKEIEGLSYRDVVLHRLLEMATRVADQHRASSEVDGLYEEAAHLAFPELLETDEAVEGIEEEHVLDALYESLTRASQWPLYQRCVEAHISRSGLAPRRRLLLFDSLADVMERHLNNLDGAMTALTHCWQLSEDPEYLRRLVALSERAGDRERAIRYQQCHFQRMTQEQEVSAEQRMQSGLWLADLLLQTPGRLDDGIDCLELLLGSYPGCSLAETVQRKLAHAHVRANNSYRAVELFQGVLKFGVTPEQVDDWRTLIGVHWHKLRDVAAAYSLQWKVVRAFPESVIDLDNLIDLAMAADELQDCVEQLEDLASTVTGAQKASLLARAAEAVDEDLKWYEEAVRLYGQLMELVDDREKHLYFERRRAFCLAHITGRELEAHEEFRRLIAKEPFETSTYRGLASLFERAQTHDRLRIARQTLLALGCEVEDARVRSKTRPSRAMERESVETLLLPKALKGGMFDVLQATAPLAEKIWFEALPQRKALEGEKLRRGQHDRLLDAFEAAFEGFGIKRFKAVIGDCGPSNPQVFPDATPWVWLNSELMTDMSESEERFVAGYCAALAWSSLPAMLCFDGRQVWHLIEGILLKQTGKGFTERVDAVSQDLAERISSPFHSGARRKVVTALEPVFERMPDIHCEAWAQAIETFAQRYGLLLSGDVAGAARCILRLDGWTLGFEEQATQKKLRNNRCVESLFEFAMSEEFLQARYALGLAGRPSSLSI
jgi:cellulose synthase operon protein C